MFYKHMMKIARTKMTWASLTLALIGSANAATLVGGGTTLPALGYVGSNAATELQVSPAGTGSLFGVFSAQAGNPAISYCQAGDGAGKNIFAGATLSGVTYNVQNICMKNQSGTVTGFGASLVGVNRADLAQPNFAVVDSPLNTSDYNNYITNHSSGSYPVQFPALAGAIAIAFNLKDNLGVQISSSQANFTDQQLCEIFSGEITDWSDGRLASAFTLLEGHVIPSNPINVQYRADGSGTTFGLSNHLSSVCGSYISGKVFEASQAFTAVVANFFPTLPSNWAGSSGELSLVSAIANTGNSIGYVGTANALASNPSLPIAEVNGASPISNFGSPITIKGINVIYNEVISDTTNMDGTAALTPITNPPSTWCIGLVPPSQYGKLGARGGVLPTGSYPIVAISYLLASNHGNGPDLAATQNLLAAPYTATITSQVTTIGPGTGLAFLTLGAGVFTTSQVSGCLVN